MIRYSDALDQIELTVETEAPGWLEKAAQRTALFSSLERYTEDYVDADGARRKPASFWSEVKPVFMRRQHNKCIYCETKLEGEAFSTVQWDLEHFRPKGNVRAWPGKKATFLYDFPTGSDWEAGYYLLAYHLHNYAAACKTCNSPFKSDYFPIAAARVSGGAHPEDYAAEGAYLVYPLGNVDQDPEELVTFDGVTATPRPLREQDEADWRRARVLIDFFGLNRDGLVAKRAWWLLHAVWPSFQAAKREEETALRNVNRLRSARAPYTNCTKCFLEVCNENPQKAEAMVSVFESIIEAMN